MFHIQMDTEATICSIETGFVSYKVVTFWLWSFVTSSRVKVVAFCFDLRHAWITIRKAAEVHFCQNGDNVKGSLFVKIVSVF